MVAVVSAGPFSAAVTVILVAEALSVTKEGFTLSSTAVEAVSAQSDSVTAFFWGLMC